MYYHQLLAAAIAHPEANTVPPLMPEAITRQDGAAKNDCERNAAKRWLTRVREDQPKLKPIVVEDRLASNGPHIELLEALDMRYLLGVKPGDHAQWFEPGHAAMNTERRHELAIVDGPNRERGYRWINGLTLNASHPDRKVNYLEHWEIVDGQQRIWSWVTDLPLSAETVEVFARAGRARWKVENETFNTLENQGDRLEHHDGHGRQHLATVFAQLTMLAFLVDRVQESSGRLFQAARNRFHARIVLWERLRNRFLNFDLPDWATLWAAMIRGPDRVTLSPAAADTSWSRQAACESECTRMFHPRPSGTRTPTTRSMLVDRASRRGLRCCITPASDNTAKIRLRAGIAGKQSEWAVSHAPF